MKLFYQGKHDLTTLSIKGKNFIIKTEGQSPIKFDVCMVFDLLKYSMSVRSKDVCIKRRAKILNAYEKR